MPSISINLDGSLKQAETIVGIDLGTTNSLVAAIDKTTHKPYVIKGKNKGVIVPSLIHFSIDNSIIVGEEARPFLSEQPESTIYSVKRLLGRSYRDLANQISKVHYKIIDDGSEELVKVKVHQQYYSPIELSSFILKELKRKAESELGTEVKKAVITVPAYFNDSQRQATRDAGKLAGLEVLRIINEPTAAALAYGLNHDRNKEKLVAVYDFGGGTFDVTILRLFEGVFDVLASNGDTYLGGDDIDHAIVQYWVENNPKLQELQLQLRLVAEEAKKHLNHHEVFEDNIHGEKLVLSLNTFKLLITGLIEKTLSCCQHALNDSKLKLDDIEEVILVGGSTRSLLVKEAVADYFNKSHINDSLNPDEVVALGAAVESDILAGNRKDLLLLDVTPLSLGIETMGGLMDFMISRNSKIPAQFVKEYTTYVDGQVNLGINVYQGEREQVNQNRKLGSFELKGIPAMPAGLPKIRVVFSINADGILKVEAKELRSDISQEIEIKPQYGLTDAQVEKMLQDSLEHAKIDMESRLLVEAKNEAKQLVYVTERFVERNMILLNDEELQHINLLINDLNNSIESDDRNIILSLIDELNQFSTPFAQRLMDISISKALKGKVIGD